MGSYESGVKIPVREHSGFSFRRHHPQVIGEVESESSACFHHCLGNLSFIVPKYQEANSSLTANLGSTTATGFPPLLLDVSLTPILSFSRSFYNKLSYNVFWRSVTSGCSRQGEKHP